MSCICLAFPESALNLATSNKNEHVSYLSYVPLARLPRILMWLACMWWAFDNVAHLPCIWLAFARVVVQSSIKKSFRFLPWLHFFFFIIGNGFQRFVGQTFITSISFKYTVCGKKGRKKISLPPPPGERNSPPWISSPGYGPVREPGTHRCNTNTAGSLSVSTASMTDSETVN